MKVTKLNKKGMTLIEIIVALAVTAIVLAALGGIFFSSYNIFSSVIDAGEAKNIGGTVHEFLCEKMATATGITIYTPDNLLINGIDTVNEDGGRLIINDNDIFGDALYMDTEITFAITRYSDNSVSVSVGVLRDEVVLYSVSTVVRTLNFKFTS